MGEEYTRKLEGIIKQMLKPLKGIPFNLVVEGISGCKIVPFNKTNINDLQVLKKLTEAASSAGKELNKIGIEKSRPNEGGNAIEPYVKNALNKIGYNADAPLTSSGKKKAMGYPDLEFVDGFGRTNYLECKTFNIKNVATTQRSFYLSPSNDFKVTKDAHHFVISFELYVAGRKGGNNIYKSRGWKILSIEKLEVDVKYEFNSDNARMYAEELILAVGKL